jgi:hypothetical protein
MTTRYLNIEAKHRRDGTLLADLKDFSVSDGEMLNSEHILSNPAVSLYCLDDEAKRAIFVELPPNIDLTTVPFIYTSTTAALSATRVHMRGNELNGDGNGPLSRELGAVAARTTRLECGQPSERSARPTGSTSGVLQKRSTARSYQAWLRCFFSLFSLHRLMPRHGQKS